MHPNKQLSIIPTIELPNFCIDLIGGQISILNLLFMHSLDNVGIN